ncbi:MAG: AzlC family ABC transporter permease [Betaproteobacteria bacterium]
MSGLAAGARAGLPVVLGYLSIGFAAGVVQRAAGLSVAEVMLLSLVLYAGSAQFVVASLVAAAVSPATAIITVFFVNLRHLLLASALAPYCRNFPVWQNALIGAQLTDETFVIAWGRLAGGAGATPAVLNARWMIGLNLSAYGAWAIANLAGALLGDRVGNIHALGFDFALAAMFGALLVLQLAGQGGAGRSVGLVVAALAALISVAATLALPGHWNILVATLVAATTGLGLQQWKSATTSL